MSTVTYRNQPAIHATRGAVPVDGTRHVYTVGAVLWPEDVEQWIADRIIGSSLHVCCGKSRLGNVRLDLHEQCDVRADAARLPFAALSFDTLICDPPYSGRFQWNHNMLNELHRVARQRIIFQHWYSPCDKNGFFKKCHAFKVTDAALVPAMPASMANKLTLAVRTDDGYFVVEEDPETNEVFQRDELAYWAPRTYFGRVNVISTMTRIDTRP